MEVAEIFFLPGAAGGFALATMHACAELLGRVVAVGQVPTGWQVQAHDPVKTRGLACIQADLEVKLSCTRYHWCMQARIPDASPKRPGVRRQQSCIHGKVRRAARIWLDIDLS